MNPEISVIMPVYNDGYCVASAIESVLGQSTGDFEFIIVDDGSTDDTPTVLDGYARSDARVRILRNGKNAGITASLNRGLAVSRGEFVARHDADDTSLPDRFDRQRVFLGRNPDVGVVGTWVDYVDEAGAFLGRWMTPESPVMVRWNLLFGNALAHPSVMMRREVVLQCGGYAEAIRFAQDYDLWLRLLPNTDLANLPEVHVRRGVRPGAVGAVFADAQEEFVVRVASDFLGRFLQDEVPPRQVRKFRMAEKGQPVQAAADLRDAALLLTRLWQRYSQGTEMTAEQRRHLARDVARRMKNLARIHAVRFPVDSLRLLSQAAVAALWSRPIGWGC